MKKIKKKWGSETWIVNNDKYCGKILQVNPGHKCSLHFHKEKTETFFIVNGRLYLTLLDLKTAKTKEVILQEGEAFTLNPLTPHSFRSGKVQPCEFIEFSTHHEDSDSYRITVSE